MKKFVLRKFKKIGVNLVSITCAIKPNKLKNRELKVLGILSCFNETCSSHDIKCEKPEALKHFKNLSKKTINLILKQQNNVK
jgi:FMN phosphatase YigB (HAD superfamily)